MSAQLPSRRRSVRRQPPSRWGCSGAGKLTAEFLHSPLYKRCRQLVPDTRPHAGCGQLNASFSQTDFDIHRSGIRGGRVHNPKATEPNTPAEEDAGRKLGSLLKALQGCRGSSDSKESPAAAKASCHKRPLGKLAEGERKRLKASGHPTTLPAGSVGKDSTGLTAATSETPDKKPAKRV
jgi:hypothetical protein